MNKSTITREWLQQTIAELESVRDEIPFGFDTNSELELAAFKMALATMDSEPVAWRVSFTQIGHESNNFTKTYWDEAEKDRWVKLHKINGYKVLVEPLYRHAQPAPVVPEEMPKGLAGQIVSLLAHNIGDKFLAQKIWNACRAAMLQASPICTCPSGDGSLRWPCPVHAGNSPVIPDSSAGMLRRWLTFGRGMQNAGSQLPHNLIAETESMLAAAPQEVNRD